ncbi:unnamed protein product [Cylicocyclus nassatus]|uniref:Uncharacterized protein n=1 Tax=Cylicocyclus nassatus TaxID=53992 RepID=A0AA36M6R4_CYLNA|nr:unnamed protein product [Cylicocyclus nassatus]
MSERFSQQQMEKLQQISDLKTQLQAAAMEAAVAKAEAEKHGPQYSTIDHSPVKRYPVHSRKNEDDNAGARQQLDSFLKKRSDDTKAPTAADGSS